MPRQVKVEAQLRALFRGSQAPEHDILPENAAGDRAQLREAAAAVSAQLLESGEDMLDTIQEANLASPWSEDGGSRAEARLALALGFSQVAEKFSKGEEGKSFWPSMMAGLVLLLGDEHPRVRREAHTGLLLAVDGSAANLAEALELLCKIAIEPHRPSLERVALVEAIGDVAARSRDEEERRGLEHIPTFAPTAGALQEGSRASRSATLGSSTPHMGSSVVGSSASRDTSHTSSGSARESKRTRTTRNLLNAAVSQVPSARVVLSVLSLSGLSVGAL